MSPDWTIANLLIQMIAGLLGAHAAAAVIHEHKFGLIGHTLVGLLAGAVSGFFLQGVAVTMVTASRSPASKRLLSRRSPGAQLVRWPC